MSRLLRVIVAALALVVVSGLPTMAAAAMEVDPCGSDCGEECGAEHEGEHEDPHKDEPEGEHAGDDDGCPDEEPAGCPPFCHACACFSPYASACPQARPVHTAALTRSVEFSLDHRAPPSPLVRGVFHPPRRGV